MTRAPGRPQKNTEAVKIHLSTLLLAEIRTKHPDLLKPGGTSWRHGALAGWIENVLWKELRGSSSHVQSQIVHRRLSGGRPVDMVVGPDEPGSTIHGRGNPAGGDSPASGELGAPAGGDEGSGDGEDSESYSFDLDDTIQPLDEYGVDPE